MDFLMTRAIEMKDRGLNSLDFVLVSGDAYVDHISFGAALIGRLLESKGYTVGIIPQPDWNKTDSFSVFGRPKLAFLVTGGNIDPMVNHYSVAKKPRQTDSYSPGGKTGLRPDRATIVYCNKIRQAYGDVCIIAGGLEASLRRLAHYDYISDKLRHSIIIDSGCDLLVYGMGERQIQEIAKRLKNGASASEIRDIPGTIYKTKDVSELEEYIMLPGFSEISADKRRYAESFKLQYENTDSITAKTLVESYGDFYVVQNPPASPLSEKELDAVYSLKMMNAPHTMYAEKGLQIPAIEEVRFSITSSRGCFGGCNFCALTFHQGRTVTSRSHKSIIEEARRFTRDRQFKGYIHDVGGPTANFRKPSCQKQLKQGICRGKRCLSPSPCKNLEADHSGYMKLLTELRELPGIKKVFIRSGIRYDYVLADKKNNFLEQLIKYHVSGQLKIAPEHISAEVLSKMGKPSRKVYEEFVRRFESGNKALGLKQYIVPYLMSSHPGSTLDSAIELAEFLHERRMKPEQVQDFYPTPATVSTCMYYTGLDPETMKPVYVPKSPHEKAMQRALIQYKLPQNRKLVLEALTKAGRTDLIGFDKHCLIPPRIRKPDSRLEKPKKAVDGKNGGSSNKEEKSQKRKPLRNIHKKSNNKH